MNNQNLLTLPIDADNYIELAAMLDDSNFIINMKAPQKFLYTSALPQLNTVLQNHVPAIFTCECFNDKNQSFKKECLNTEIAHLFEHILLAYLCKEKLKTGSKEADYSGFTSWDWNKETLGVFRIEVNAGLKDKVIIGKAFKNSVRLFKKLFKSLESAQVKTSPSPSYN